MRTRTSVVAVIFAALAVSSLVIASYAVGAEPQAAKTGQPAQEKPQWYNGGWWFQMPNSSWVYWSDNRWSEYRPVAAAANQPAAQPAPGSTAPNCPPQTSATYGAQSYGGLSNGYGEASGSGAWAHAAMSGWGDHYFGRTTY